MGDLRVTAPSPQATPRESGHESRPVETPTAEMVVALRGRIRDAERELTLAGVERSSGLLGELRYRRAERNLNQSYRRLNAATQYLLGNSRPWEQMESARAEVAQRGIFAVLGPSPSSKDAYARVDNAFASITSMPPRPRRT